MASEENNNIEKSKTSGVIKNIILIVFFLIIGFFIGSYVTNKYLESREDEVIDNNDQWPIEITSKTEYNEQVDELYSIVRGNPDFYSTKGLAYNEMNDNDKLIYIYNNLIANSIGENVTLNSTYYGSPTCDYGFIVDSSTNSSVSLLCTVIKLSKDEFESVASTIFNDKELNTNIEFLPTSGKKCVVSEDSYLCGNVNLGDSITGSLETKFEIYKVTKDKDDTINIYDKGYLIDKRSNVINPDDGIDNYYLHSSDSTQYYYELKSADNLSFIHTFKKNENGKYYFVSSTLYKE